MTRSPKRTKVKNTQNKKQRNKKTEKGIKRHWPFKSSRSHFSLSGRGLNNGGKLHNSGCPPLCLCLCDRRQQQWSEHRFPLFRGHSPFCPPYFPTHCVQGALGTHAACQVTRGEKWIAAIVLSAEIDWKLSQSIAQAFPWKLLAFNSL